MKGRRKEEWENRKHKQGVKKTVIRWGELQQNKRRGVDNRR